MLDTAVVSIWPTLHVPNVHCNFLLPYVTAYDYLAALQIIIMFVVW